MPEPDEARLTITWAHVDTYRSTFPVTAVAETSGLGVDALLAGIRREGLADQ